MAVVLALASAVVYGASDFLGGLASRRTSVSGVVALSQVVGLVALLTRIEELACTDPLTELPNRRRLEEQVETAIWDARSGSDTLALLFVDLDGFKAVNDCLGHAAGDELLQTVARTLHGRLRRGDLLARLGEDEFLVVLTGLAPESAAAEARRVADELSAAVGAPVELGHREVAVGASVGIGVHPVDGEAFAALLPSADVDTYARKTAARRTAVARR